MILAFFLYSIPLACMLGVLIYKPARKYYVAVKSAGSVAFVGTAIYCGIAGENLSLLFTMLPGFLMCLCGDVFLGTYNARKVKKLFLAGVLTFMLGHVFFVLAFLRIQPLALIDFLFPIAAVALTVLVTGRKHMVLGKMRPYIYIYSFFVAMLFGKSVHIFLAEHSLGTLMWAIGGCLFFLSDFLILFLYFYDKRPWSTHGWNLVTYYYAMFLLAASLLYL